MFFSLEIASCTDIGRRRPENLDSTLLVVPEDQQVMLGKGALFVVADGTGTAKNGASRTTVNEMWMTYYQSNDPIVDALISAVKRANIQLYQLGLRENDSFEWDGVTSTCTAIVLHGASAYGVHVGDSRAYLVHQGQLKQLSQDHTWVAARVRMGMLTPQEARMRNKYPIYRTLGTEKDVDVDRFTEPDGDSLILCTDGLTDHVEDEEIKIIAEQCQPRACVDNLIHLANERGGRSTMPGCWSPRLQRRQKRRQRTLEYAASSVSNGALRISPRWRCECRRRRF